MHPSAHLTIGAHTNNRWPVALILTPKLFAFYICKQYYPENWKLHQGDHEIGGGFLNKFDLQLANEKSICAQLELVDFTERERKQLYFS
jgi:hypothetical protein